MRELLLREAGETNRADGQSIDLVGVGAAHTASRLAEQPTRGGLAASAHRRVGCSDILDGPGPEDFERTRAAMFGCFHAWCATEPQLFLELDVDPGPSHRKAAA